MIEINKIEKKELFNKANILTRLSAFYLDTFFIFYICWLLFKIFNFNPIINLIFFLCFYLSEYLFGYTIGKFVFRLRVIDINGNKISIPKVFIRNLPKLIPLILLLTKFKINDDQGYFSFLDIILINLFPVLISMQILLLTSYFLGKLFLRQNAFHDYFSKSLVVVSKPQKIKSIKTIGAFFAITFIIIQVLFIIAIPSFIHAQTRAKISSIKSNMHSLQDMVETYSLSHDGLYPENIDKFKSEAKKEKYWKDLINPCNGLPENIVMLKSTRFIKENIFSQTINKGDIAYFTNSSKTKYIIYGAALIDNRAIKDKDQIFYLSNE